MVSMTMGEHNGADLIHRNPKPGKLVEWASTTIDRHRPTGSPKQQAYSVVPSVWYRCRCAEYDEFSHGDNTSIPR